MQIIGVQTVKRYHVKWSKEETLQLKHARVLPLTAPDEADVWWTAAEVEHYRALCPRFDWSTLVAATRPMPERIAVVAKAAPDENTAPVLLPTAARR